MTFAPNKSYENHFPSDHQSPISSSYHKNFTYLNKYNVSSKQSSNNLQSSFTDMKRSNVFTSFPERASYKLTKNIEAKYNDTFSSKFNSTENSQNFKHFQVNHDIQKAKSSTSNCINKDFKFQMDTYFSNTQSVKNIDNNTKGNIHMYTSQIVSGSSNRLNGKLGLNAFGRTIQETLENDKIKNVNKITKKQQVESFHLTKMNTPLLTTESLNRFPVFENITQKNTPMEKDSIKFETGNCNIKSEDMMKKIYRSKTYSTITNFEKQKYDKIDSNYQSTSSLFSERPKTYENKFQPNDSNKVNVNNYGKPLIDNSKLNFQFPNPFKKNKIQEQENINQDNNKHDYFLKLSKKTVQRISAESKKYNEQQTINMKKSAIIQSPIQYMPKKDYNIPKLPSKPFPTTTSLDSKNQSKKNVQVIKLTPPKKFTKNDFVIGKKLGKGKFGDVFLVKEKETGFVCAMKIISKSLIREQKLQNQFARQILVQFYLQHQNITALYGYFDDSDNVYLLLQLCLNGQLFTLLKQKKRLCEEQASSLLKQICVGTEYMHRQRIIHRDLKPENIIMQNGVAKICDFGWAVYRADGLRQTFCGTPLYVSPEILKGEKYDQKIDIWSIGILCYELLIGRIPFKISCENDLKKIINDEIIFPEYIPISTTAKDFILKILKKKPEERMEIQEVLNHEFLQNVNDNNNSNDIMMQEE